MYVPRPFTTSDSETSELLASLRAGHLITATAKGILATFIPFIVDADGGRLLGHVARANDQWREPVIGDALVIAEGAHGYISPGWYQSKLDDGRVVPTWDYVVMHIRGALTIHDDVEFLRDVVTRLTDRFEAESSVPWQVTDAPADYVDRQLRGIVGIEVAVTRVEASAKLSQNRTRDIDGVVRGLQERGDTLLAGEVERHRPSPRSADAS